jgi:ATP-binding cassette subfamily F protein uup
VEAELKQEPATTSPPLPPPPRKKLGYKETRELELLPARIEKLETEIAARTRTMHDPAFFKQDAAAITAANQALAALQAELDAVYARWQELET